MIERISNQRPPFALTCFLIILLMSSFTGCQKMPRITSPGKKLIRQSAEAAGGLKKLAGWDTRVEKGILKVNWPGWGHLKADCSRYIDKPHSAKIDNNFTAYDHPFYMTYYCNSDTSWSVVNLQIRQGKRISSRMREFIKKADGLAYYLSHSDTFFTVRKVPEDSLVDAEQLRRAGVVMNGDTILLDINKENYLLTRMIDQGGERHTLYHDYRKTAGPMVPFHVQVYRGGKKQEEHIWNEINFNVNIDPEIFREKMPSDG